MKTSIKFILLLLVSINACSYDFEANKAYNKPDNISKHKWSTLKAALQESKLVQQDHTGIAGAESLFGSSLAIDGNRALIGAPGTAGHGVAYVFEYDGSNWNEVTYLEVPTINTGAEFGASVSLLGDMALIGATGDDENGAFSGAVYVFELALGSWSLTDKLLASNAAPSDKFGVSISRSGNDLLIGAEGESTDGLGAGAAYMFSYSASSWTQSSILYPNAGLGGDEFGGSVSLENNRALIGAVGAEIAYVFEKVSGSWDQVAAIVTTDTSAQAFADSVSLSGDRALIGAWADNTNGVASGAAFIFDKVGNAWTQTSKILPADGGNLYYFGQSVSLKGDVAVVGAIRGIYPNNGASTGSAYVFELSVSGWSQTSNLFAVDATLGYKFGSATAFWGTDIMLASVGDMSNGVNSGSVYAFQKNSSVWLQSDKILADSGAVKQYFGSSISLWGNRAAIGAWGDSVTGVDSGAVYIFEYVSGSWTLKDKLFPNDSSAYMRFGHAVSLYADRVLISSFTFDIDTYQSLGGFAYIFDYAAGTWNQTVKLTAADDTYNGSSVSLYADRAVVGDLGDISSGNNSGLVHIYEYNSGVWAQTAQLVASDAAAGRFFGQSLSLSMDRLIVGAVKIKSGFNGAAYVFDYSVGAWSESSKLLPFDGNGSEQFGISVDLLGDRAIVGAEKGFNNNTGTNSGAAYIYEVSGNSWSQVAKLYSADGATNDLFAKSVSLSTDTAVIGAPAHDGNGIDSGSVYTFNKVANNWLQVEEKIATDTSTGDNYGYSVASDANITLVGSNKSDTDNGKDAGAAYAYINAVPADLIFANGFE